MCFAAAAFDLHQGFEQNIRYLEKSQPGTRLFLTPRAGTRAVVKLLAHDEARCIVATKPF
jgi:hypothetical protein